MQYDVATADEYIEALPDDRKEAVSRLRQLILENLPEGFEESIGSGMINYSVPLSLYPAGYHVTPGEPLPFLGLASQKNYIALYHLGLQGDPELDQWFRDEYRKAVPTKLDMGLSCIRLKNTKHIPYDLIAELLQRMSPQRFIAVYESALSARQQP